MIELDDMIPDYRSLDEVEVAGKTLLIRCDLNVAVDKKTKKILETFKIEAHRDTLHELVERGAKLVIISHQSRPGKPEFISLKEHSQVLSKVMGVPVKFVDDVYGEKAINAIGELKNGEILVLENLRFYPEENEKAPAEKQAKTKMVRELAKIADIYVCDAFACSHRSQPSMVGFPHVLPSMVARLMQRELEVLKMINWNPAPPTGYVIGGAKLEEAFMIIEQAFEKQSADYMFITGVPAIVFLQAKGYKVGKPTEKYLEKNGYGDAWKEAKKLLDKVGEHTYLPVDLAVEKDGKRQEVDVDNLPVQYPIKDIGSKTIEEFSKLVRTLKTVFANGPAGVFEDANFKTGTEKLFQVMADSGAYSVVGGGDTSAAVRKLGISGLDHVSSGGGALLNLLAGKESPALVEIAKRHVDIVS